MANMHATLGGSRKRKRGDRVFRFESFCEPGYPAHFKHSFKENIEVLLEFGRLEAVDHGEMKCWSYQLELHRHPPTNVRLFIVEEVVGRLPYRQCHYCRYIGWGHHMICNKRYHFVLPTKDGVLDVQGLSSVFNGERSSKAAATGSKLVDFKAQLMHGVVHLNGFGHLLCVNGIEGGSDYVSGHQIMDLWDRICTTLQVRKVSLTDAAKKGTMELRLIHGVAYGEPWFGRWGYRYGRGSYGVSQQMHRQSLEALRSLPLCLLIPRLEIRMIVAKYQALCGQTLLTLGDLFRFMIELKARLPPSSLTAMDYHGIIAGTACRWSTKRVEMAAQVIVEALRKYEFRWVTRQEVRDAARAHIGDTGLLDYVLKSLGNHIVGSYVVRRMVNPVTKVLEYCLEDVSHAVLPSLGPSTNHVKMRIRFQITKPQLMRDLLHLYKHVLREQRPSVATGVLGAVPVAVRMVLDVKHLVKDYQQVLTPQREMERQHRMNLMCTVHLRNHIQPRKELPPFETISIPTHATLGDLKREVGSCFRELYWGLRRFVSESVVEVDRDDEELVVGLIEPGSSIVIRGVTEEMINWEEIYEGWNNDGVVDCPCGAREEDGERMVCCDICEVWQHTRCVRIPNDEEVPRVYLCNQCDNDIISFRSIQY